MEVSSAQDLVQKKCVPCEGGGVEALSLSDATNQLKELKVGWELIEKKEGMRIRKEWKVRNFMAGMDFFQKVAVLAEEEGHHPDIHLEGYQNVSIEIWTHAIGGLSENDFVLAAKIDELPITLSKRQNK